MARSTALQPEFNLSMENSRRCRDRSAMMLVCRIFSNLYINPDAIPAKLKEKWQLSYEPEVNQIGNYKCENRFVFTLRSAEDAAIARCRASWKFMKSTLALVEYDSSKNPNEVDLDDVEFDVSMYNIPPKKWIDDIPKKVASILGTPVSVTIPQSAHFEDQYIKAKIKMKMKHSFPATSKYLFDSDHSIVVRFFYGGFPRYICPMCIIMPINVLMSKWN